MAQITGEDIVLQGLRLVSMAIYTAVAVIVIRRHVSHEAKLANQAFATWWLGLAILGLFSVPAGFGWNPADAGLLVWRIWIYVLIPLIYVALGGLLYYLLYLYTGRHAIYKPIVGFYILMTVFLVWLIEGNGPYITTDEMGETTVEFVRESAEWVGLTFSLGLVLPIFLAALAYGILFFRVEGRPQKYRIALISGGILIWFAFSLFNTISGIGSEETEQSFQQQVISQLLGLLAASMALIAFAPPPFIQGWLDAEGQQGTPS